MMAELRSISRVVLLRVVKLIVKGFHFIFFWLPQLVVLVIGSFFTVKVFQDYKTDTTGISNAAFAIMASLAALSFSRANVYETAKPVRDRFVFAGERSFYSAVMLLLASVLKYGLLSAKSISWVLSRPTLTMVLDLTLGGIVGVLFMNALVAAHSGVQVIWELFDRPRADAEG